MARDFRTLLHYRSGEVIWRKTMRLKDKVALVTGAGSGIGRAIAERFAAEGAHVVINYHPGGKHSGVEVQEAITKRGQSALALAANVSRRQEVETMFEQAIAQFGQLDIVISNAGIQIKKPFVEMTDQDWSKVIDIDLYGAFLVSQAGARQMVKQGRGGKIIFISSVHEDIPFPGYTAYCVAKGGIRMMMRNLSMELAQYKINVNNVAPGAISTPINEPVLEDPEAMKAALEEIPWGRFGKAEEVASVATFLVSDEADYVT